MCVCCVLSRVQLFATPWTVAHQAPLSMEFPRREYSCELPFPSPGDLPNPEIKPRSPVLPYQAGKNLTSQAKSHRAFRSSHLAFWVQEITVPRPLKDLLIQENKTPGLLDTGTDVS